MVQIGTHSGSFHCDEALGCWMLQQLDKYKDATIVRSRDPEVLKQADIVIDGEGVTVCMQLACTLPLFV